MKKLIGIILITFFATSCLKIEVKPEKVVSDTVSSTKEAYDKYKLKKKGYKERNFSHKVKVHNNEMESDAAVRCLKVTKDMADSTSDKKVKIISENTNSIILDNESYMECTINAFI